MGILGKFNRRKDLDKIKTVKSPVFKSRPVLKKRSRPLSTLTSPIARYNAEMAEPFEPIPVSIDTVKAIEVGVQDLNLEASPRSIASLANAMAGNRKVLKAHGHPSPQSPLEILTKQLRRINFRNRERNVDDDVQRRYEIMKAFNRLEKNPMSSVETISSWEEAKNALKSVLIFPEDQGPDEGDDKEAGAIQEEPDSFDIANQHLKALDDLFRTKEAEIVKPYSQLWKKVAAAPIPTKLREQEELAAVRKQKSALDKADNMFRLRLESETAEIEERLRRQELKDIEEALRARELEEEARKRASSLMRPLSDDERSRVRGAIHGQRSASSILVQCDSDSIQQQSFWTLKPAQWVNDEVIHYFLLMLAKRDEELCRNDPSRKRCHFFKSFFMTKILNEGHATMDGQYEYRNVKRWSKNVPGKDLFKLDKVFFPINQGNMHWLCACAFIQEKRIEVYDSMGSTGRKYLKAIFQYLQDDYNDKKGSPMPDVDDWELVETRDDTPQQRNGMFREDKKGAFFSLSFSCFFICYVSTAGYDCGVFTCMFIDFLSKDCPLVFSQDHINQCRERIALSILNGKAIM